MNIMEELNIFHNPLTGELLPLKSALLMYRLRNVVETQPYAIIGDTNTYLVLFGTGQRSHLILEAISEYQREIVGRFKGKKLGELNATS